MEITLVYRRNFHLFQPLSYQVATGALSPGEVAYPLRRDFRAADPRGARILLLEAADRVLTAFPESLSAKAERSLRRLGVTPLLGSTVVDVDETGVTVEHADGTNERIAARTVVWAAGVTASGLAAQLAELTGAEQDRASRVTVEADLTLPGHPEVLALGDMVRLQARLPASRRCDDRSQRGSDRARGHARRTPGTGGRVRDYRALQPANRAHSPFLRPTAAPACTSLASPAT